MAYKYLVLVFLAIRSLKIIRAEYEIYDVNHIPTPTHEKINDIFSMVATISTGLVLYGSKESITFPIKNTKEGIPKPQMADEKSPI